MYEHINKLEKIRFSLKVASSHLTIRFGEFRHASLMHQACTEISHGQKWPKLKANLFGRGVTFTLFLSLPSLSPFCISLLSRWTFPFHFDAACPNNDAKRWENVPKKISVANDCFEFSCARAITRHEFVRASTWWTMIGQFKSLGCRYTIGNNRWCHYSWNYPHQEKGFNKQGY